MITVTAKFLEALRGSHEMVAAAAIVTPGATGTLVPAVGGSVLSLLNVVSGTVTLDCTANIRGTLQLVVDAPWATDTSTSSLAPYGTELCIWRGVRYGNGTTEYVQLGIYRIESVEQQAPFSGQLTITGSDRMGFVNEAKYATPVIYDPTAGWTWGTVLADIVNSALVHDPTITWDNTTLRDTAITGQVASNGTDRVATLNTMLLSLPGGGKVAFFDNTGTLQVMTTPTITGAAVFTVDQGATGVFLGGSRTLTRTGAVNTVVVTSEAAGATAVPVLGTAADTMVGSPTNVLTFGIVPAFYQLPLITTVSDATASAATILASVLGIPYVVQLTAIPNPALTPYDVITVTFPADRAFGNLATVSETHVIDSVAIPLDFAGTLSINTRAVTVA